MFERQRVCFANSQPFFPGDGSGDPFQKDILTFSLDLGLSTHIIHGFILKHLNQAFWLHSLDFSQLKLELSSLPNLQLHTSHVWVYLTATQELPRMLNGV